ncbi:MAG TPA: alginate lyase family protein [Vicinamibacterales bacterium]|nr:alginate lyase family protein [Vicinamibacterales bacterium]
MTRRELAARSVEALRTAGQRVRTRVRRPAWRRRELASLIAPLTPDLAAARDRIASRDWGAAHAALCRHFTTRPPRFLLHPSVRADVRSRVLEAHPGADDEARALASRIAAGWYDLLGYQGLRFGENGRIDWHLDPVSGRRAPFTFWADVPYLDPACGDHKVIWELNRHQEWLMLGRASWLAHDRAVEDDEFARAFTSQLASWMRANPPGMGINWASSLELAFRSISWLSMLELFAAPARAADPPWTVDLLLGIARQVQHVEGHLSRYFSPNTHLLGEALALYVCGRALPELTAAPRWAALGRRMLIDQARRQVLPDGVHAERSPHYHRYALDFHLMALSVARITGDSETADRLRPVAAAMAEFMRDVTDDTGRHPQIGDDDGGELAPLAGRSPGDASATLWWAAALLDRPSLAVGQEPEAVAWLTALTNRVSPQRAEAATERACRRSASYPAAGYFISRRGDGHLVFDAGAHGFLNGGHAHSDALAITLAVHGRALLADSGTGTYTMDPALRDRLRSTHAHNTLTIDGRSQSVPGGPFHWMERSDASPGRVVHNPRFDYFEGRSGAYAPLVHERLVLSLDGGRWIIADRVSGDEQHEAALHWHLDPAWRAIGDGPGGARLRHESGAGARLNVVGAPLEIVSEDDASGLGLRSPAYGRLERGTTLRCRIVRRPPITLATVIAAGEAPRMQAKFVEVLSDRAPETACAVLATGNDGCEVTLFADGAADSRTLVLDARRGLSITTDARLLHARLDAAGWLVRFSVVDCSLARFEAASPVTMTAPAPVRDLDVVLSSEGLADLASSTRLRGVHVDVETGSASLRVRRAAAGAPGGRAF